MLEKFTHIRVFTFKIAVEHSHCSYVDVFDMVYQIAMNVTIILTAFPKL